MGSVMVYQLIIKGTDREFYGSWLPEGRVLKKIRTGLDKQPVLLSCWTKCADIFNSDVDYLLENGDVDFSKSITKGAQKSYYVEADLETGKQLQMEFGLTDDSVSVNFIQVVGAEKRTENDCSCD